MEKVYCDFKHPPTPGYTVTAVRRIERSPDYWGIEDYVAGENVVNQTYHDTGVYLIRAADNAGIIYRLIKLQGNGFRRPIVQLRADAGLPSESVLATNEFSEWITESFRKVNTQIQPHKNITSVCPKCTAPECRFQYNAPALAEDERRGLPHEKYKFLRCHWCGVVSEFPMAEYAKHMFPYVDMYEGAGLAYLTILGPTIEDFHNMEYRADSWKHYVNSELPDNTASIVSGNQLDKLLEKHKEDLFNYPLDPRPAHSDGSEWRDDTEQIKRYHALYKRVQISHWKLRDYCIAIDTGSVEK